MSRIVRFTVRLAPASTCALALALALLGAGHTRAAAGLQPPPAAPAAPGAAVPLRPPAALEAPDPVLEHATTLAKAGKFKEAIAELEAARKAGKASARAQSLLGRLYVQMHRPEEAMAILHPLIDSSQAEPATLYNAGLAALMLKRAGVAQDYFQRSVALEPASPAARELGLLLAHQGRVVEAYALLRPWAIRNTDDGEALLTAASLAVEMERPQEAEQMLAGMPQNSPAIVLLRGKVLVQKGDGKQAAAMLTPLLAKHPGGMETEIRRTLAEAYLLTGQAQQAVSLLSGRVNAHPTLALLLARAQHQGGDSAGALATLRPFIDKLPEDAKGVPDPRVAGGIAEENGRLLAETGKAAEGISFLERATRIEPDRQEVWEALGKALNAAGRKEEARKAEAHAAALAQAGIKSGGP
jgi:Flp pilus assembly protein TadD